MLPSAINLGIAKVIAEFLHIKGSHRALAMAQKARCLQHWLHFSFEGIGTGVSDDKHGANEQRC